jgi:hypothetical protein
MKPRTLIFCCLGSGLLFFSGCWKSSPSITGTVRLDGDPLPSGWIHFIPVEGTPGPDAGAVIEEGEYRVTKGLVAGEYRVEIHGSRESTVRKERDPITPTELILAEVEAVPAEYNKKSQLTATVQARSNPPLDFNLTSNRKRE